MNRIPEIRFPDYTEPWEQRKVSDLLEERNEQAPESEDYPLMAFIANEGVAPKGERYDRGALVKDAENKNYKKTELGDFIYSSNNLETGSIGLNNYGNASISPVYSIFKPTGIAVSDFIGRRFVRKDFINSMVKWRQGVVYGQWKIHESDFLKIEVAVPSLDEQRKIGSFLSELDNLITLHQRELEQLRVLKRGLLQKMFPQEDQLTPEIRFTGFKEPWEQCKLGDIADCLDSMRLPLNAEERKKIPGNIPYYGAGNIQGYINKYLFDEELVLLLEDGDAFEDYQSKSIAQYVSGKAWVNNHAHVLRPHGHAYFLYSILAHKDIRQWTQLAGASRKKLVQDAMLNIVFSIPSIEEQAKIGNCFSSLDDLIILHQRKSDKLNDLKRGLLQKMFV